MSLFNLNALTVPLHSQEGMTHAVLQSVYNYAESTHNDRARMNSKERGGTWSQEWVEVVGSRDWTLKRTKLTDETLSVAKRFYEEALAWLINDGYARAIQVSVWRERSNQMGRNVKITLLDGSQFNVPLAQVSQ